MSRQTLKVDCKSEGLRVDIFLTQNLLNNPSRSFVQKLIESGYVTIKEVLVKANHRVSLDEEIEVDCPENFSQPHVIKAKDIPLNIFYEDEWLYVIYKPIGMVVHPAQGHWEDTLVNALLHRAVSLSNVNSEIRPGIVHRLDQETSGLILIAKDNITHTKLAKQFQRKTVMKKYIALVEGNIGFDEGKINAPIARHKRHHEKKQVSFDEDAKESLTYYKVIKRCEGVTLVHLFPKTGRTHQLRVHMAYLKHPILGDSKYGDKRNFSRLALHAQSIKFVHPATKERVEFSTRPPEEFLKKVGL